MERTPHEDMAIDRIPPAAGDAPGRWGYGLRLGFSSHEGDATTPEIQTLCQGSMVVGFIACRMRWDWPTTLRTVNSLAAPLDGFLLIEVSVAAFFNPAFRRALREGVAAAGLDPYKVKVTSAGRNGAYVLGHGLPHV